MLPLRLGFSIADQNLRRTKSVGILNVSLGLLQGLAQRPEFSELEVFTNSSLELPKDTPVKITAHANETAAQGGLRRMMWDQIGVYRAARKAKCDWLLLPKGFASFLRGPPTRLAVYVHDAMHDFYRTHYPSVYSGLEARYFQLSYRATLRRADLIFTNSNFTTHEVKRMAQKLGLREPRVVTAGIGFASPPVATTSKQDVITMLVSRWPHKLTGRALEWLGRWQKQTGHVGAVRLVGDLPSGITLPSFPNWKLFSRLGPEEFEETLGRSKVVIYFSEYEGFGMPPIEASFRGAAPVYSQIPAMEESVGGAGFSFSNDSYDSFAAALGAALVCTQEEIAAWAKALAERHTWARVAERIAVGLTEFSK
jgi:hypothetical protein